MFQIGVLFGGRSSEHNISLRSGTYIYNTLDRTKFRVKPILIDSEGYYYYPKSWDLAWSIPSDWASLYSGKDYGIRVLEKFLTDTGAEKKTLWEDPSLGGVEGIFLGLHGGEGEDGRLQAVLETIGLPYTGSGVLASALAMDKYRSNHLFSSVGIPVASSVDLTKKEFYRYYREGEPGKAWENCLGGKGIQLPVFSKPTTGGSSVGTFRSETPEEWESKIREVFETESRMLVQENIRGREVSCGVLEKPSHGSWEKFALPPTEIIPLTEFFDFSAKYIPGKSQEITPPKMDPNWITKIQELSILAHETLGCSGYSRTDFIVTESGTPWILETNTLPGMTGTSLVPQQAEHVGISMQDVFTWLVHLALERKNIPVPWVEC